MTTEKTSNFYSACRNGDVDKKKRYNNKRQGKGKSLQGVCRKEKKKQNTL